VDFDIQKNSISSAIGYTLFRVCGSVRGSSLSGLFVFSTTSEKTKKPTREIIITTIISSMRVKAVLLFIGRLKPTLRTSISLFTVIYSLHFGNIISASSAVPPSTLSGPKLMILNDLSAFT